MMVWVTGPRTPCVASASASGIEKPRARNSASADVCAVRTRSRTAWFDRVDDGYRRSAAGRTAPAIEVLPEAGRHIRAVVQIDEPQIPVLGRIVGLRPSDRPARGANDGGRQLQRKMEAA